MPGQIITDKDQITAFCQRWQIMELALFGSVLREDFSDQSDIDVLVTFEPDFRYSFGDLLTMQQELGTIFERPVDLGERVVVEQDPNYIRRRAILNSAQVIYAR